ncbi:hypothetical protein Tco_1513902, partial [Tanacetum coccineum]
MIQVKEMMQDNDLKNSKSKDKGSKSRSQSMDKQSRYKQDKTITRWVWIDLDAENDLSSFRLSMEMDKIFTEFKPIDKDFVTDERVVWIDIVGVPLCAWTSDAFKKIGTLWGESLFVDIDKGESLAHGKAPDFEFEDDCESNESSESNRLDGKKSDTSSSPTAFEECYTEQPMYKSGQEQSDSDPFNLMGLIEKHGINLVKKDKEFVINCDTDKETDQTITTEFNKDQ